MAEKVDYTKNPKRAVLRLANTTSSTVLAHERRLVLGGLGGLGLTHTAAGAPQSARTSSA